MPEIRYHEVYQDSVLIERIPYEVPDEKLADEAEAREVEKIQAILEQNWTSAQAIKYLKLLIKRLLKKGILP